MGNCGAKPKEIPDVGVGPPSELTLMKKAELKRVLDADGIKRQDGDAWYVVEAAWVQRWLAFVQGDDSSKKPGPIRNETLLCHNTETKTWGPKPLLRAARREHMGHYRRVNEHVWALWVGCYTGSGPALWVETPPFEDSSNWILDPSFRGVKGSGGDQARQGGAGAVPPDRLWPSSTPNSLAIGDMEDDGVGEENAAKVAAFFDVVLDSPRVSHGAAAAAAAALAAAPPGGGGSSSGSNSNGISNGSSTGNRVGNGSGNVNNRGSHRSSNRSNSNRSGTGNPHGSGSIDGRRKETTEEDGTESRLSSTAKQWMYGGGGDGSME